MPTNNQDLREMVYHTDARVTAMEGQMSNIAANQAKDSQKLDNLISVLSQPKTVNYAAWVGVCLTVVAMLIGGSFGMVSYMKLTQTPIEKEMERMWETIEDQEDISREHDIALAEGKCL